SRVQTLVLTANAKALIVLYFRYFQLAASSPIIELEPRPQGERGKTVRSHEKNPGRLYRRTSCRFVLLFAFFRLIPVLPAQTSDADKPIPVLSGSAGYFNFVTGGQNQINAQVNPVLLLPMGDHWLVESRAEFQGVFQRPPDGGPYYRVVS